MEQFKRRVMDMVSGWQFPGVPEAAHVPSDRQAEAVRDRQLAERRTKMAPAVGTICMIDKRRVESMDMEVPPSYEEVCGEVKKGWRERVREYRARSKA